MKTLRRQDGFTLLELLIAASLVCLVSVSVFTALSSALNVAGREPERGIADHEGWLAVERLARDYQNGLLFPGLPVRGGAAGLSFPCVTGSRPGPGEDRSPAHVEYSFDPARRAWLRRETSLARAAAPDGPLPAPQAVLEGVSNVRIDYLGFDRSVMQRRWSSEWKTADRFPLAIRVELELARGGRKLSVTRVLHARPPR